MVFLTLVIVLTGSGAFLPRLGRLCAAIFGLIVFLIAVSLYRRDGAWTFIHNDVLVMLLAGIGGCVAIGALLREAVVFLHHKLNG